MPARNKKNFRSTKSGAGMTAAGVAAYRSKNPGSKLSTAVTEDNPGKKRSARRKSYCARSLGQMKKFPKAAKDPNSRLRQARTKMEMLTHILRILRKLLGYDILLIKELRILERKTYWREKYKHGLPERKPTSNIL